MDTGELGMSDTAVSRWLLPVVFTVMGSILIIGGIIELIRIINGSKVKKVGTKETTVSSASAKS